jgi:hypothetical protein
MALEQRFGSKSSANTAATTSDHAPWPGN